jgi:hypothetical protein
MSTIKKITLHEALAEIKSIKERINDYPVKGMFIDAANKASGNRCINSKMGRDEASVRIKSDYDSYMQLCQNLIKVKSALFKANTTTMIDVAGKQMTILEAIHMKSIFESRRFLYSTMKNQYLAISAKISNIADTVEKDVVDSVNLRFGGDKAAKNSDNYDETLKTSLAAVVEMRVPTLVDPIGLAQNLSNMEIENEKMIKTIDFILSITNAKTEIEVEFD